MMEKEILVKLMRLVNMTNSLTVGDNGGFKVIIFVLSNSSQGQSNSWCLSVLLVCFLLII